jgi:autotransporter-associated beta strand protein
MECGFYFRKKQKVDMMKTMRRKLRWVAILSVLAGFMVNATAQTTYYWDADGATAGFGSDITGDWNASAFWSTSPAGTSASTILWPNSAGDNVVFSAANAAADGIINVQNVWNGSSVNSIATKAADYMVTLKGQTSGRVITLSGDGIINVEDGAAGNDLYLDVDIAGTVGFNKTGAGTLYKKSVDGYTGTTRISEGTLKASNNAIPDDSAVVVESGATLTYADGGGRVDVVGSIAGAGNLVLKGNAGVPQLTSGGDNSSTEFSGVISSADAEGFFWKTGTGTLTLSGDNTYSQDTIVEAGGLVINGDMSGSSSSITLFSGAMLGGNGTVAGDIVLSDGAQLLFDPAVTLTADGTSVDLGNLSVLDLVGLDSSAAEDTYSLIDGLATFDFTGVLNLGLVNAADLGDGKSAYFQDGVSGLNLVVIPEPGTLALLGIGGLGLFGFRRKLRI